MTEVPQIYQPRRSTPGVINVTMKVKQRSLEIIPVRAA